MAADRLSARTLELLLDCGQTQEHTKDKTYLYIHRIHIYWIAIVCLANLYYAFPVNRF